MSGDGHIVLFDHISPASVRGCIAAAKLYAVGRTKHFIKQSGALGQGLQGPRLGRPGDETPARR